MCPNGFIKIFVIGLLFSACENKGTSTVKDTNAEYEGNTAVDYDKVKPSAGNAHGAMGYVPADGESAEESKAKAIQMQIDSAYKSIALLEEAKIALNNTQDELLSTAERNAKSKAIYYINQIQNEMCRAVDASIINNLKMNAAKLSEITSTMEDNVNNLKSASESLQKAAAYVTKTSNIFSTCFTSGWIKPAIKKKAQ